MKRFLLVCSLLVMASGASAETCIVADPTGTPLNVRVRPGGAIVGALHNGVAVDVLNSAFDSRGSRWVYISPREAGKAGWVFRDYLDCR